MNLSNNFQLGEFLLSQTAARHGIDMAPPAPVLENLERLVRTVLQPLRNTLGRPIRVTSGYRPPELNSLIGGSRTSAHMFGRAADIIVPGMTPFAVASVVADMQVPYDQVIHEFGQWTHIGIADLNVTPRQELLTALREDGKVRYVRGILRV